jgi:hypothetical protein
VIVQLFLTPDRSLVGPTEEEPYLRVKNRTATALARLQQPEGVKPLIEMLNRESNSKLIAAGIAALARLVVSLDTPDKDQHRKAALKAFQEGLDKTSNESVRYEIISGFGILKDEEAVPNLIALYDEYRTQKNRHVLKLLRRVMRKSFPDHPEVKAVFAQDRERVTRVRIRQIQDQNLSEERRLVAINKIALPVSPEHRADLEALTNDLAISFTIREALRTRLRLLGEAIQE